MQYRDPRLPLRPDQPELEFAVEQQEITSTADLQQVGAAQFQQPSRSADSERTWGRVAVPRQQSAPTSFTLAAGLSAVML